MRYALRTLLFEPRAFIFFWVRRTCPSDPSTSARLVVVEYERIKLVKS